MEDIRKRDDAVQLAIAAVEDTPLPNPLDTDLSGIGESPSYIDLVLPEETPRGRCSR